MPYTGPHNQLNQIVLSDTLNEWREKNNQHVDILNNIKMYDVVAGDGITFTRTGGSVTLEIAPNLTDGITIGGDLVVQGNITFTGTAAQFDTTVFTVDDHQIELGASGANNAAGANDVGVNDGGIILKSTQGDKKWTWLNAISGHAAWFTSEHLGISSGKSIFGEDNVIRFENSSANGTHIQFTSASDGGLVANISYATGATAAFSGNGTGTGGIRLRQDGSVEITQGVNRIFVEQTAHGFVHGDVVRWDGTQYVKAQGNSESNAEAIGVVDRMGLVNSNQFEIVTHGQIKGFSGGVDSSPKLTNGEVHFLDTDDAGKLTINRPFAKGAIVKPMLVALGEEVGYVVNYIGGLVPSQEILANSVPQTWRMVGDGTSHIYGLSGSASTIAGSHIVSINGVMQIPENDGGTQGSGTGITFGVTGGTGPASFRIVEGPGSFGFGNGNRIEFVEPPVNGAEIIVVNHALTTPFEAVKETFLRPTGATEQRLITNILGDHVSVKDYGAVGDGTTDDTTAIQRAINQSETNANQNKRKIFFPTGTYLISSPLQLERHNVFLYGEGSVFDSAPDASRNNNKLSTIKMNAGMTGPAIQFDFSSTVGETDDYVGGFKMEDMVVWASEGTTGTDGNPCPIIDMSGCWVSELNRIATYGHTGITSACGVRLHGYYNNQITDSMIGRYSANGIEIHGFSAGLVGTGFSAGYTRPSFGIRLHGNLVGFTRVGDDNAAIRVEGGTFGVGNLSIEDNVLYSSDYGVYLAGSNENVIVKNNTYAFRNAGNGLYGSVRCTSGITSDGLTRNLIEFGNTGSQYGNTGDAFFAASATDKRIEMNDGSVLAVNTPKVIALFDAAGNLIGGTGNGGTGTNYNVNHITKEDTGEYIIHFVNDLQTDNYSIQGCVGGTAGFVAGFDRSAVNESSCRIYTYHVSGSLRDPSYTSVTII